MDEEDSEEDERRVRECEEERRHAELVAKLQARVAGVLPSSSSSAGKSDDAEYAYLMSDGILFC